MTTIKLNINKYHDRLFKKKMYMITILEVTNENATDLEEGVYSVKTLHEQRCIRTKKDAKALKNTLIKKFYKKQ